MSPEEKNKGDKIPKNLAEGHLDVVFVIKLSVPKRHGINVKP